MYMTQQELDNPEVIDYLIKNCNYNYYKDYIGYIINNCKIIEKSTKSSFSVKCQQCNKEKQIRIWNLLNIGAGCCVKQVYETLDINKLYHQLYKRHLANCKADNKVNKLIEDDYIKLIMRKCEYPTCNETPIVREQDNGFIIVKVNGVDRIDSNKGYLHGNLGTLCWKHNQIKGAASIENLIYWSEYFKDKKLSCS